MIAEYFPADLAPPEVAETAEVAAGLRAERRRLSPTSMQGLARGLRQRASEFRKVPAEAVLSGLAELHQRWASPNSRERSEAVARVRRATGYPAAVIDESLQRLFSALTRAAMKEALHRAGIHPVMLDAPGAGTPRRTWAYGPKLTAVISSGNIPGAALPSVVQALLLKSPCLVKTASAEPFLLPLYAQSLAAHHPDLARALVVTHWEGGADPLERALLSEAEALVVYGSDGTLQSLRERLPVRARFLGYGHRISFSAVGRELLGSEEAAREAARLTAYDLCVYDQQGCYSPQAIYVEAGGAVSPERFAELLAGAFEEYAQTLPRRSINQTEAASIHQYRVRLEMRGYSDPPVSLWTSETGTSWTVALASPVGLEPCVLNRTAVVLPLEDLSNLSQQLVGRERYLLSAVLGVSDERMLVLADLLAAMGVCRVARLGQAQAPETSMDHDGVNALAQLTRFVTVDSPWQVDPKEG